MSTGARSRRVAPVLVALLVAAGLGAGVALAPPRQARPHGAGVAAAQAAAVVDDHAIPQSVFVRELALIRPLYSGPRGAPGTAAARTVETRIADRAIDQAIGEYLIVRAAARARLTAPPAEVARTMRRMVAEAGGPGAQARWGISPADVRHAATLAVLNDMLVRRRRDPHWLDGEAQASTIRYFVGSRAGLSPDAYPDGAPGHIAPGFVAWDLRGQTVALAGLRGHGVVLTLWNARCLTCRGDLVLLQTFARRHPTIRVIALDEGDGASLVRAYLRPLKVTYAIWLDGGSSVEDLYNATGLPATYIVDRQGVVRDLNLGPLIDEATLDDRAAALLAAPRR